MRKLIYIFCMISGSILNLQAQVIDPWDLSLIVEGGWGNTFQTFSTSYFEGNTAGIHLSDRLQEELSVSVLTGLRIEIQYRNRWSLAIGGTYSFTPLRGSIRAGNALYLPFTRRWHYTSLPVVGSYYQRIGRNGYSLQFSFGWGFAFYTRGTAAFAVIQENEMLKITHERKKLLNQDMNFRLGWNMPLTRFSDLNMGFGLYTGFQRPIETQVEYYEADMPINIGTDLPPEDRVYRYSFQTFAHQVFFSVQYRLIINKVIIGN